MKIVECIKTEQVQITDTLCVEDYETRYRIEDENGNVTDDAQGYGYKSRQKAAKAVWYKFKGGREKRNDPVYVHQQAQKRFAKAYKAGNEFVYKDKNGEYHWEAC